ncbi:hypothetical protein L1987_80858 [Smallanthus sonchifolius]|uniref:Uncharacterized protein n=1 Tax=Smallanthus sonchifolius TaxID=185202 RepID=A0ACB8YQ29_9ASTR|nr:hypothetical protein L1987_80858 [Smallanthus sonchifolius]
MAVDKPSSSEESKESKSLHPVYSVTNIQNKIRVLDGKSVTYSSWLKLFKLHAKGYKVLNHIDGTPPPAETDPTYESWSEIDAIVLQWIYGTISDSILSRVLQNDTTAQSAWNKIQNIFWNNKTSRIANLEHQFTNLKLTACASLQEYCQKLKEIADQMEDVEHPIDESRLIIQLVKGLPKEFNVIASLINQSPTSWDDARKMIELEQQRLEDQDQSALLTPCPPTSTNQGFNGHGSMSHPPSQPLQSPSQYSSQTYRGWGRGRGRGGGRSSYGRGTGAFNQQQWGNWNEPTQFGWSGPPPCTHPAHPNWASPWFQRPTAPPGFQAQNNQHANLMFGQPGTGQMQAGVNPLCLTELGAAL